MSVRGQPLYWGCKQSTAAAQNLRGGGPSFLFRSCVNKEVKYFMPLPRLNSGKTESGERSDLAFGVRGLAFCLLFGGFFSAAPVFAHKEERYGAGAYVRPAHNVVIFNGDVARTQFSY